MFIKPPRYAVEANRFLTYPLKQDVPLFLTWWCFWTQWSFFYSIVAVPRSAVPFTLTAAGFNVSAKQHSSIATRLVQHLYDTGFLRSVFFFLENTWGFPLVYFMWPPSASGAEGNLLPLGVTLPSNRPYMNKWNASIAQRCVQVATLPLTFRHRASSIYRTGVSLLSRESYLYI